MHCLHFPDLIRQAVALISAAQHTVPQKFSATKSLFTRCPRRVDSWYINMCIKHTIPVDSLLYKAARRGVDATWGGLGGNAIRVLDGGLVSGGWQPARGWRRNCNPPRDLRCFHPLNSLILHSTYITVVNITFNFI